MTKSLTSKLHLKQRLYSHRMKEGMSLEDHLIVFKGIVSNLETMEVKYDEEYLGLILLCLLSSSYVTFRDIILYSRDTLTLKEVFDALFSKEKMKQLVVRSEAKAKSLIIWGWTQQRNSSGDAKGRSKSNNKDKTYRYSKKNDISNLNDVSYKIRIIKLLQIKRENNKKNLMKLMLQKMSIVMENS